MKRHLQTGALLLLAGLTNLHAAVLYVDLNCPNPTPPYADWSTAATTIQDAVDAASAGDTILVTNGVYQTGGRPAPGDILTNRVVVTNAITLQSINGPAATVISGYQVPGTCIGDAAVRCVHLADGSQLSGFTLANGATRITNILTSSAEGCGGGVWCQSANVTVSNCVALSNCCSMYGGGVYWGTVRGCQIHYNTAYNNQTCLGGGGGIAYSMVWDSTVRSNSMSSGGATSSGGAMYCAMSNCILEGNYREGASGCLLTNCSILNNTNLYTGGGVVNSLLDHCTVAGNRTSQSGGGAYNCRLDNCVVSNNWAGFYGGGVYSDFSQTNAPGQSNLVSSNSAARQGGGAYLSGAGTGQTNLTNWTFAGNSSASDGGGLYLACGLLVDGCRFTGNYSAGRGGGFSTGSFSGRAISNSLFSSNSALADGGGAYNVALVNCSLVGNKAANGGGLYGVATNCVFTGNVAGNGGGLNWSSLSLIMTGCNFTNNSAVNGGGAYGVNLTNCVFSANVATANGGGVYGTTLNGCLVISNQAPCGGGAFAGSGTLHYPGTAFAYLGCRFTGNSATNDGGGLYCVSYGSPGTNCLLESNSAGGNGGGLYRLNQVGSFDPTFGGCTLRGNSARTNGGGAYNGTLSGCVIANNVARAEGGGAYMGILSRCVITNNVAGTDGGGTCNAGGDNSLLLGNSAAYGGGAYGACPYNSTLVGNQATVSGGGFYSPSGSPLFSCLVYNNTAPSAPNYSASATCSYCCTTPLPSTGSYNIASDPCFVNAAAGNYRLQTNSPCINTGMNTSTLKDLDGRRRVVGGATDIGAYEFQGLGMGEFIPWLQQCGLPTDGSADYADTDHDGVNNWQEWLAGTDPTDATSALKLLTPAATADGTGTIVSWQSVTNRTYFLQRSQDLLAPEGFSTIQSNVVGQLGITSVTDTNAPANGLAFYRVGVQ